MFNILNKLPYQMKYNDRTVHITFINDVEAMVGHNAGVTAKIKDKFKNCSISHCIHSYTLN